MLRLQLQAWSRTFTVLLIIIVLQVVVFEILNYKSCRCNCKNNNIPVRTSTKSVVVPDWERTLNFTGFNNETGTPDGHYIVPNYVHFIKFKFATFNFIHMVCVLAAFKNQRPEKLFIHTDVEQFHGKYWDVMVNTPGFTDVLIISHMELPTKAFDKPLNPNWLAFHGGDVARLMVMRKYGGIYLDNDSYLIRSMDDLRRYELAVAWRPGKSMMNQVVVAHKDARLLKEWQDGYKDYRPEHWFYNAGRQPANVLLSQPHLAHSIRDLLGTYDIRANIYLRRWEDWRTYYSCHLMVRWVTNFRGVKYPNPITERDVLKYNNTFQEMIRDVYDIENNIT